MESVSKKEEKIELRLMRLILNDQYDVDGAAIMAEDGSKQLEVSLRSLKLLINQLMSPAEQAGEMDAQLARRWLVYYIAQTPISFVGIKLAIPRIAKEIDVTEVALIMFYRDIISSAVADTLTPQRVSVVRCLSS